MEEYLIYKKWLKLCDPLQEPLATRKEGGNGRHLWKKYLI